MSLFRIFLSFAVFAFLLFLSFLSFLSISNVNISSVSPSARRQLDAAKSSTCSIVGGGFKPYEQLLEDTPIFLGSFLHYTKRKNLRVKNTFSLVLYYLIISITIVNMVIIK